MRTLVIVVGCVALSAAWALGARAQSEGTTRYDAYVREAVIEYNAGNWGEARLLFGKAHELQPNARTWRGMGLSDYESKRYVQAIEALEAALESDVKPLDETQRREAQSVLDRSLRFVAVYTLELPEDATELHIDGRPVRAERGGPLHLNPGKYTLSLQRASGATLVHSFEAAVGERATLNLAAEEEGAARAEPVPRDAGSGGGHTWTWVAAGTTVAFGAASIALGALASDAHDDWHTKAAAGEPADDQKRDGQRLQLLSNVGFGLTAAAAVGTAILWLVEDEPEGASAVRIDVGLASISVRGAL